MQAALCQYKRVGIGTGSKSLGLEGRKSRKGKRTDDEKGVLLGVLTADKQRRLRKLYHYLQGL